MVEFQNYPKVNSDSSDPTLYGDIITHCKDWRHYADSSKYTTSHEVTHGINNDLRLSSGDWNGKNGFYVGSNRAILFDEPKIKKHQIVDFIPQELRSARFSLYVQGQQSWDDKPLYIYDEGVAYINGAWAAIELKEQENYVESTPYYVMHHLFIPMNREHPNSPKATGRHIPPRTQMTTEAGNTIVDGEIEFIPYMTAVLMAVAKLAPPLDTKLIEFSRWLFRRASNAYYRTLKDGFPKFDVQDKLWDTLKNGAAALDMRNFLRGMVGYICPDGEIPEDDTPWNI